MVIHQGGFLRKKRGKRPKGGRKGEEKGEEGKKVDFQKKRGKKRGKRKKGGRKGREKKRGKNKSLNFFSLSRFAYPSRASNLL